jgi:hypothetical protein
VNEFYLVDKDAVREMVIKWPCFTVDPTVCGNLQTLRVDVTFYVSRPKELSAKFLQDLSRLIPVVEITVNLDEDTMDQSWMRCKQFNQHATHMTVQAKRLYDVGQPVCFSRLQNLILVNLIIQNFWTLVQALPVLANLEMTNVYVVQVSKGLAMLKQQNVSLTLAYYGKPSLNSQSKGFNNAQLDFQKLAENFVMMATMYVHNMQRKWNILNKHQFLL